MKYNKQTYKSILQFALERGFKFVDFLTANADDDKSRQLILRHDIDYSIALAYQMAEIDAACKIKSTFALLSSSPLYNPFTPDNIKFINEIQQLGHNIVLHHHVTPGSTTDEIKQDIVREIHLMRTVYPNIMPVFVWHDLPPKNLLSDIKITGMVNAYNTRYIKRMFYISDSILRHKPETFFKVLDEHKLLHMLLHPIIWMSEQNNMISMVSYVLTEIIRDCDKEFLVNRVWKEKYPNGIPREILDILHRQLSSTG